jgi:hypothetical protein
MNGVPEALNSGLAARQRNIRTLLELRHAVFARIREREREQNPCRQLWSVWNSLNRRIQRKGA